MLAARASCTVAAAAIGRRRRRARSTTPEIHALIDTLRPSPRRSSSTAIPPIGGRSRPSRTRLAIPRAAIPRARSRACGSRRRPSARVLIQTAGAPARPLGVLGPDRLHGRATCGRRARAQHGPRRLAISHRRAAAAPPPFCSQDWEHSELAIGSAVEVRMPYAALDAVLPASMQGKLMGAARAAGCACGPAPSTTPPVLRRDRLRRGRRELPPRHHAVCARPAAPARRRAVHGGSQSAPGPLVRRPGSFHASGATADTGATTCTRPTTRCTPIPVASTSLADNFSFGEPILAPAAGTVFSLDSARPDHPPYGYFANPGAPNFLFLEIPGDLGLLFTHSKQGSIPFAQGNPVPPGAFVGASETRGQPPGRTCTTAQRRPGAVRQGPARISNAAVGLNPTASDPWRRDVPSWGIREGYFVLPEPGFPARSGSPLGVALLARPAAARSRFLPRSSAASSAPPVASPAVAPGSGRSVPSCWSRPRERSTR